MCRHTAGEENKADLRFRRAAVIGLSGGKLNVELRECTRRPGPRRSEFKCASDRLRIPWSYAQYGFYIGFYIRLLYSARVGGAQVNAALFQRLSGKAARQRLQSIATRHGRPAAAKLGTHSSRRCAASAVTAARGGIRPAFEGGAASLFRLQALSGLET